MRNITMNEIIFESVSVKALKKLKKMAPDDYFKIADFIFEDLQNAENPLKMPNCTKLVRFNDNRYRWRLGNHRIIARVEKNIVYVLRIMHIGKRDENTYA